MLLINSIDWDEFRNKSILLFGGSGFISKNLIEILNFINNYLDLNIKLAVITTKDLISNYSFLTYSKQEDITWKVTANFVTYQKYDYVIHAMCPANNSFNKDYPDELLKILINGTRNIFDILLKYSPNAKILYLSSGAVYGTQNTLDGYRENNNSYNNDDSAYSSGKRTAELICGLYHKRYNLDIKISRIFSVFGPQMNLNDNFAMTTFIRQKLTSEALNVKKGIYRSYMYSVDLIIWLLNILLDGKPCYPYNVGSKNVISLDILANLISDNIKYVDEGKFFSNSGDIYAPSISRAGELNLVENYSLEEAVEKTVKFYI